MAKRKLNLGNNPAYSNYQLNKFRENFPYYNDQLAAGAFEGVPLEQLSLAELQAANAIPMAGGAGGGGIIPPTTNDTILLPPTGGEGGNMLPMNLPQSTSAVTPSAMPWLSGLAPYGVGAGIGGVLGGMSQGKEGIMPGAATGAAGVAGMKLGSKAAKALMAKTAGGTGLASKILGASTKGGTAIAPIAAGLIGAQILGSMASGAFNKKQQREQGY